MLTRDTSHKGEAFRPASIMRMRGSHESSVNPRSFAQPPHVEAISMPTNLIKQLQSFQTVPSTPIITRGNPNLQSGSGRWIPFFVRPSNSVRIRQRGTAATYDRPYTPTQTSVTSFTKPPVPELAMILETTRSRSLRLGLDWPDWA